MEGKYAMKYMLTIQIPTYRNHKQLTDTLASLLANTEFPYQVVIIDNGNSEEDGCLKEKLNLDDGIDNVRIIETQSNLGWMAAHNLALKQCDTPYVCLLNDDVFFLPADYNFWRNLTGWLSKDPSIGAVGPCSNFVMGAQNLWQHNVNLVSETSLLIGFCVVMRTDLLKKIGGLDETLPGGDDLDWSIRIRDAGYRLIIDKSCFLFHIGQQTGKRVHRRWDSPLSQERTNNALIKKHGIKKWYSTFLASHQKYGPPTEELFSESVWYKKHADQHNGQNGLNLGCGHMDIPGVPGLDIAKQGETGHGGRKIKKAVVNITGDATNIPVKAKSLDFLFAAHIFEHLIDPVSALAEWRRVLKPEARLYASLPNHDTFNTIMIDASHMHAYTPDTFKSLMESQGWDISFCEPFDKSVAFGVIAQPQKFQ